MVRTLSVKNLYSQRFTTLEMGGEYETVFGHPSDCGTWLIYGKEKNGKTTFALQLAKHLSMRKKTLYVSGEEGAELEFTRACLRAGIDEADTNLHFIEYEPLEELRERLKKRKSEKIIFIDNITIYNDELKGGALRALQRDFPNKLFIFIAHEDDSGGTPATSSGKLCRRLAKIICHVEGLMAIVSGRCPGGQLIINDAKAAVYYGNEINQNLYDNEPEQHQETD
jgi:DNA polymerase III delta prime subunit|nr:MAG TPA: AAA domain protein [Caudoviricetes sp.]